MKIEFDSVKSLNRKSTDIDVRCHKVNDLSILAKFKNLQKLQLRTFKGKDLSFLKELKELRSIVLENVIADNELEDLSSLTSLEVLTIQTPVGWDGSGK